MQYSINQAGGFYSNNGFEVTRIEAVCDLGRH